LIVEGGASPRVATRADLEAVIQTLWLAFRDDPLWRWAFPGHDELEPWWRLLIGSALRYPWVWAAGDYSAAAVWIPPGGSELTEGEEERVEPLIAQLAGDRAPAVMDLIQRFGDSHPQERPHYYLSLLGTRPDRRGQALGMTLLRHNLALIDAEGMPAYLESSNPENDARYARLGFEPIGEFSTPDASHTVTTMWREPSPGA
jgi:GNAT superfamily N-acetyltransferase